MTVKELIDKLSEFDSDLEIEFEFDESCEDGGTWALKFDRLLKCVHDKESLLEVLKTVDPDMEVTVDPNMEGETENDVNEDSFEVDAKYNALVIKSGCMPDRRDWERSCWWKCRN